MRTFPTTLSLLGGAPLGAILVLSACGGGATPEDPDPSTFEDAPTELQFLGAEERVGDDYRAWGLTGRNKPNGPVERYRRWVPPETPAHIPRELDGLDLWIAERADGGWATLYGQSASEWRRTDAFRARFHDRGDVGARAADGGAVQWDLDLNRILSRDDLVEVQDIRYDSGDLFFNEACITYAQDAQGDCSSIVRVDPTDGQIVWRSRDLVSNNIFLVLDQVLVTGYGFTAEPDSVFLLDRDSGEVLDSHHLDTAHAYMEFRGDTLHVVTRERIHRFLIR